jgi:exosortase B
MLSGIEENNRRSLLPATPVVAALLFLYGPAYVDLAGSLWQTDAQAHAPLIAVIAWVLLWRALAHSPVGRDNRPSLLALPALAIGVPLAYIGLTQEMHLLTVASQPLVVGGGIAWLYGREALRNAWFPLMFMVFMIPLPGFFIDALTAELKTWISAVTEEGLYAVGYPIARIGVTLTIGQYQLLVADACSGLHSMVSLSAFGTLYIRLVQPRDRIHTGILVLSLIPIAFASNLVRVVALVLLTYYQGEAVARSLHDALGLAVFLVGLLLLLALDSGLARLMARRTS